MYFISIWWIYCDVDNEPLVPLDSFIEEKIDFLICCSFSPKFNYNLILSYQEKIIIKNALIGTLINTIGKLSLNFGSIVL